MTWANQVKILKQQFEALGAVIGGGLINALKPFVQSMNAVLGGVISFSRNVINALGKIFGWEYEVTGGGGMTMDDSMIDIVDEQASGLGDVSDAADDAAKSVSKAAKANEEYKRTIFGFDEINKLTEPTKASDGGSGSTPSTGGTGKGKTGSALPTASSLGTNDIQVAFKRTKALYESEIDSLYELGAYIGKTLTDTLNGINWENVYEGARGFGTGLANFLNGLITPDLFSALGRTIAGALNTALYAFNSFTSTFDFTNFGRSVAAGVNAFFLTFDWGELGTGIAAFKNGVYDALIAAFTDTKWEDIGLKITEGINNFLKEFKPSKIIVAARTFVNGVFKALETMFINTRWDLLFDNVKQAFDEFDLKETGTQLIATLWAGITGEEMNQEDYENVKNAFAGLEEILGNIADLTFHGCELLYKNFLKPLTTWTMAEAFPRLSAILTKFDTIIDWKSINDSLDTLTGILGRISEGIGEGLVTFFEDLGDTITWGTSLLLDFLGPVIKNLIGAFDTNVKGDAVKSLGEGIGIVLGAVAAFKAGRAVIGLIGDLVSPLSSLLGVVAAHPMIGIAALGVGAVLSEISDAVKFGFKSEDAQGISDTANAIKTLSDELASVDIDADTNYTYISNILDKYLELNGKLVHGEELTTAERSLLDQYYGVLEEKVPGITEKIGEIGSAYKGTKKELEDLIKKEIEESRVSRYVQIIKDAGMLLADLDVQSNSLANNLNSNMESAARAYLANYNAYQGEFDTTGASELAWSDEAFAAYKKYLQTHDAMLKYQYGDYFAAFESGSERGNGNQHNALWFWNEYADAMIEVQTATKKAQDTITAAEQAIADITGETSSKVRKESGAIEATVTKTSQKTAHAIDESGKAVEKGIERPWKKAYSTIKKEGAKASEAAEEVMDDIEEEITNSGPDLHRAGTGAAGAGLGAVRAVLEANVNPLTSKYKFIAVSMIEGFNKTFGIHGNTSTVGEEQGKKITGGIGAGTDAGTPSLVTKFTQLPGKLKAGLGDVFNFFRPSGSSAVSGIQTGSDERKPSLVNFFAGIPGALVSSLGNMKQTFKPSGVTAITGLQAGAEAQRPSAVNAIVGIKNALVGAFAGLNAQMWGTGHDAITSLRNGWTSVSIPTPHFNVSTYHSKELNMKVPNVAVGWYASGGLATSPSLVGVGEAGNEAILPLKNPGVMSEIAGAIVAGMIDSGAMANAITKGMVAAGQNNDRPVIVNATLRTENNEVLARAVAKGQQQINYRHSPVGR